MPSPACSRPTPRVTSASGTSDMAATGPFYHARSRSLRNPRETLTKLSLGWRCPLYPSQFSQHWRRQQRQRQAHQQKRLPRLARKADASNNVAGSSSGHLFASPRGRHFPKHQLPVRPQFFMAIRCLALLTNTAPRTLSRNGRPRYPAMKGRPATNQLDYLKHKHIPDKTKHSVAKEPHSLSPTASQSNNLVG